MTLTKSSLPIRIETTVFSIVTQSRPGGVRTKNKKGAGQRAGVQNRPAGLTQLKNFRAKPPHTSDGGKSVLTKVTQQ